MSELIDNSRKKRETLKKLILRIHEGESPEKLKKELKDVLGAIPYDEVVKVEQELIAEGLPQEEVIKLCDVHTEVLEGSISQAGAKNAPPGHPVHTWKQENAALGREVESLVHLYRDIKSENRTLTGEVTDALAGLFNNLFDVDTHYRKKENLLFPYLEKHGVTAPPQVMWAKHDETRDLLKKAHQKLAEWSGGDAAELIDTVLHPASHSIVEMIDKEEQILFPMSLDTLTEKEWYSIYRQESEIGYCLYDPSDEWKPEGAPGLDEKMTMEAGRVQLPSGSLSVMELTALMNTMPADITFVDSDDRVRYFTQGNERIFDRNRAIIGRKVQQCHPPSSVHVVEQILADFKAGKQHRAAFWITMKGRFIHIEYFALRNDMGEYLGTIEVSQDLTEKRKLEGEQRLLDYSKQG